MLAIKVTHEFPEMNPEVGRRPFKVLTPPDRSGSMVIARYRPKPVASGKNHGGAEKAQRELVWKAVLLGLVCATLAFGFLSLRQRHWFERSGEDLGAVSKGVQRMRFGNNGAGRESHLAPAAEGAADAKTFGSSGMAAKLSQGYELPEIPNTTVTEFNLPVTTEFQEVGNVELLLSGANASTQTYDITIRTARREFYQQDVKVGETVALSRNGADGGALLVASIGQGGVRGYLREPLHRGHRRHRRRR